MKNYKYYIFQIKIHDIFPDFNFVRQRRSADIAVLLVTDLGWACGVAIGGGVALQHGATLAIVAKVRFELHTVVHLFKFKFKKMH